MKKDNKWKDNNCILAINYRKKDSTRHWVVYDKDKDSVSDPNPKNKDCRKTNDKRMKVKSHILFT